LIREVAASLETRGPLARQVPGFAARPQQQAMARAVAATLAQGGALLVEAGTGVGKTYAYLVPVLLQGGKTIISTGARHLQEQIHYKDLPVVRRALGVAARSAILKGRGNYLCLHRLNLAQARGLWRSPQEAADFAEIHAWAGRTRSGDIAELAEVAETSPVWPRVTSTADNCLGQECPCWQDCHVVKARRQAQEADILIINHHLFFADMAIKETGFAELLPGADNFILDEAHQLPDLAGQFFGLSLSSGQLLELARDTRAEQLRDAGDDVALGEQAAVLEQVVAELRLALGQDARRAAWREVARQLAVRAALSGLEQALAALQQALEAAAERGKGLENCSKRSTDLVNRLRQLTQAEATDGVYWFETRARWFALHRTPLEIAATFSNRMEHYRSAWIFTSATLAVGDDFSHFTGRLGLIEPATLRLDSPFDFARQALLYQPPGLPDPASADYAQALTAAVLPVLAASRGRAFLLFTSYRALAAVAAELQGRLDFPILIQGSSPKGELLARFRALGNAVLLGTTSFWEGVDVRGEALSCVIIDKLPFASPSDPVLQARIEALRQRGGDPFLTQQLPQAVIVLKQGVGRLIRDSHDRGVLMLCDPRLSTRSYGRIFLDSLPPMPRTRQLAQVQRFFAQLDPVEGSEAQV